MNIKNRIFKKGSKTYYYSSLFFPKHIRKEVTTLYAYVRVLDDFVDIIPPKKETFYEYKKLTAQVWKGKESGNTIIDDFVTLAKQKGISKKEIDAFIEAMESDLKTTQIKNQKQLLDYTYGSAEVIGIMMNRIMGITQESDGHARLLGRSMQLINFIRDIAFDLKTLGRTYIPSSELKKYGLDSVAYEETSKKPEAFIAMMRAQVDQYNAVRKQAHAGIGVLPRYCRLPVLCADAMYAWSATKIYEDPFIVYRKVVKPSKLKIIGKFISLALKK